MDMSCGARIWECKRAEQGRSECGCDWWPHEGNHKPIMQAGTIPSILPLLGAWRREDCTHKPFRSPSLVRQGSYRMHVSCMLQAEHMHMCIHACMHACA